MANRNIKNSEEQNIRKPKLKCIIEHEKWKTDSRFRFNDSEA